MTTILITGGSRGIGRETAILCGGSHCVAPEQCVVLCDGRASRCCGRTVMSMEERKMPNDTEFLRHAYDRFNARDMEAVLATMHRDVVWASGLEGGHIYGHDGVRDYWTRQWAMMDSRAEPISFSTVDDGTVEVEVPLTARDRDGKVLFDQKGRHAFRIENGLIKRFDIR